MVWPIDYVVEYFVRREQESRGALMAAEADERYHQARMNSLFKERMGYDYSVFSVSPEEFGEAWSHRFDDESKIAVDGLLKHLNGDEQ